MHNIFTLSLCVVFNSLMTTYDTCGPQSDTSDIFIDIIKEFFDLVCIQVMVDDINLQQTEIGDLYPCTKRLPGRL
jgi:hypothetical protein